MIKNWAVPPHKQEGAFVGTAIFQAEGMGFIDSWQADLLLAFWNENNFLLSVGNYNGYCPSCLEIPEGKGGGQS